MDILTILSVLVIVLFVIFFGNIITHALKFVFYVIIILLVAAFIFGISVGEIWGFVTNLIFTTF